MSAVMRARVRGGRLVLDEPTELPEGSEVALIAVDHDDLDEVSPVDAPLDRLVETEQERRAVMIARASIAGGRGIAGEVVTKKIADRLRRDG